MIALSLGLVACGDDSSSPPSIGDVADAACGDRCVTYPDASESCKVGESTVCHVELPVHGGVHSCFVGIAECVDGGWGPCVETD